jgi:hypothetical protein
MDRVGKRGIYLVCFFIEQQRERPGSVNEPSNTTFSPTGEPVAEARLSWTFIAFLTFAGFLSSIYTDWFIWFL